MAYSLLCMWMAWKSSNLVPTILTEYIMHRCRLQVYSMMLETGVYELANGQQPAFGKDFDSGDSPHNSKEIVQQRLERAAAIIRQDPQLQVREHTAAIAMHDA